MIRDACNKECEGSKIFKVTRKFANCRVALLRWRNTFQGNVKLKITKITQQLEDMQRSSRDNRKDRRRELKS